MKVAELLSVPQRAVVKRCLDAAVNGPFFPEWEFQTLFGCSREEVRRVSETWPDASNSDQQIGIVINTLNNLIGYPHGEIDAWGRYINVPNDYLETILDKLASYKNPL